MITMHREHEYILMHPEILTEFNSQLDEEEVEEIKREYADDPKYSTEGVFDIFYFYSKLTQDSNGYVIAFFIALFAVMFAGSENSTGFIKNIAGQASIRHRTILSKCLSILVFSGMALIITLVLAMICSQLLFGYIRFGLYSTSDMIVFSLTQLLLNAALGIVVMCFSELIKNQTVSMAIGALLSIGVARLITDNLDDFFQISNFSFSSLLITINKSRLPLPFNFNAYQHAWTIGVVFIVLASILSIISMKKRDIR
jgi:ABC-2 type transport system permease protein